MMSLKKAIGGSFGAIAILVIAQTIALSAANIFVALKVPEGVCHIIAGAVYLSLAYVLLKQFIRKLLKLDVTDFGLTKFRAKPVWVLTAVLLPVTVKSVYLLFFRGEYVFSGLNGSQIFSALSSGIAFIGIAAGFVEEMVFRGVILNLMKKRWNIYAAVLIPSVLFGLAHIIGMDFSLLSCLLVIIAGTAVGIMFSVIAIESGSVWCGGIVHSLWNIIICGGGLSIGESVNEYSVMTYVLGSKSFALTGGEFGIESSCIALLGYITVTLAAVYMIRKKNHSTYEKNLQKQLN